MGLDPQPHIDCRLSSRLLPTCRMGLSTLQGHKCPCASFIPKSDSIPLIRLTDDCVIWLVPCFHKARALRIALLLHGADHDELPSIHRCDLRDRVDKTC